MRKGSPTTPQLGQAKPSAPACLFQIGGAGGVVGEKPLELGERFREGEGGAIENVHSHPLIRFRQTGPPCRVPQSDNQVVRGELVSRPRSKVPYEFLRVADICRTEGYLTSRAGH